MRVMTLNHRRKFQHRFSHEHTALPCPRIPAKCVPRMRPSHVGTIGLGKGGRSPVTVLSIRLAFGCEGNNTQGIIYFCPVRTLMSHNRASLCTQRVHPPMFASSCAARILRSSPDDDDSPTFLFLFTEMDGSLPRPIARRALHRR
jgi:hypothetical protein